MIQQDEAECMVDPYQDEDDETCIFGHPGCDIDIHLLHIKHADELLMAVG
jgi:hypothetical protein